MTDTDYAQFVTGDVKPVSEQVLTHSEQAQGAITAQQVYRERLGPRPVTVHLLTRIVTDSPQFLYLFSPNRWGYVVRYPNNITVFATTTDGETTLDGWLWHHEIRKRGRTFHGNRKVMAIYDNDLHPIETMPPEGY